MNIKGIEDDAEVIRCAQLMCGSEPWITLQRSYDQALAILRDPDKEVYLAMGEGQAVAGFVILNMNGAFIGYIQTVCVAPEQRGGGIGSRLVKFAEDRIFRETPNVFMCASSFNPRALQLYERLGYEVIGELKDYLIPGHSEILLRKTIGPIVGFVRRDG